MIGWMILVGLALATFAGLLFIGRVPRGLWQIVAAVLVLAMAGYALQGRPDLPGSPAKPRAEKGQTAEALIAMRADMDQSFGQARPYLITSDGFARNGNYKLAAAFIKSGLKKHPDNADLWAGLGLQLMLASDGQMSPPARLAFDRADALYPGHPAAEYFTGLNDLFEGRIDLTLKRWQALADRGSETSKWKPKLESQNAGLDALARQAIEEQAKAPTKP